MTDFTRLMCSPPAADWTESGIYRAAYLALFNREDRAVLRRAGRVMAAQAISGDTGDEPAIVANLRAAGGCPYARRLPPGDLREH